MSIQAGHLVYQVTHAEFRFFKLELPASILEKSRMSLMMRRSASPRGLDQLQVLPLLFRQPCLERQLGHPEDAWFMGVRISWLMFARNSLLKAVGALRRVLGLAQIPLPSATAR